MPALHIEFCSRGEGKYDHICTLARETAMANGCLLVIFGGFAGNGFSVQVPPEMIPSLPDILRKTAELIEKETA